MRKSIVSVLIGLLMLGISGNVLAGVTATDVQCNPLGCVNDTDIAAGAVTNVKIADGAVTSAKVSDGAITDAKITGPISASKIEKQANVIVVAQSGGDFTSISDAIASLPNPNTTPVIIKVMPGTYTEMDIYMKSNVHLQGAGRDVTILQARQYIPLSLYNLTNVTISGFTISDGSYAIYNYNSSVTITNNTISGNSGGVFTEYSPASIASTTISGNIFTGNSSAIINFYVSPAMIIRGNSISGNSGGGGGIYNVHSSPVIVGNMITGNNLWGIANESSSPTISGNIITENTSYGIYNYTSSSPKIINNRITGNGGTDYADIYVDSGSVPNISFNIYDSITGTSGVGQFNVNSNGDFAPAP